MKMENKDINEIIRSAAGALDLSKFSGDIVMYKHVEKEVNVAEGGIGEQHIHYGEKDIVSMPEHEVERNNDVPDMSVEDKLRYCIKMLEKDAMINFKQDFAIVLKVIRDEAIKYFTNESFADFVSAIDEVPTRHKPREGNMKMLTISDAKYPDIKVVGVDDDKQKYYKDIANQFYTLYSGLK